MRKRIKNMRKRIKMGRRITFITRIRLITSKEDRQANRKEELPISILIRMIKCPISKAS